MSRGQVKLVLKVKVQEIPAKTSPPSQRTVVTRVRNLHENDFRRTWAKLLVFRNINWFKFNPTRLETNQTCQNSIFEDSNWWNYLLRHSYWGQNRPCVKCNKMSSKNLSKKRWKSFKSPKVCYSQRLTVWKLKFCYTVLSLKTNFGHFRVIKTAI